MTLKNLELNLGSLKAFRVLLGFFISYDLIQHLPDVSLFYTDDGLFPLSFFATLKTFYDHTFYSWVQSPLAVHTLYIIHLGLALCFMCGFGLRFVPTLLWIFQLSLRNRNPAIVDGADNLMVLLTFYSQFLPLNGWDTREQKARPWANHPLWKIVLQLQILAVYLVSTYKKTDPVWNETFQAAFLALRLDILSSNFGKFLLNYPTLLKGLTAFVYYLEFLGPLAFIVAIFIRSVRLKKALIVAFILFHLGLSACMKLGVFPYIAIAMWVALWPGSKTSDSPVGHQPSRSIAALIGRGIIAACALWMVGTIILWNTHTRASIFLRTYGIHLALHQDWSMFAPWPTLDNYRINVLGLTKPLNESDWTDRNRHRTKFWLNMDLKRDAYLRAFAYYLCNKHKLDSVKIVMTRELIDRQTLQITNRDRRYLIEHFCY